MSSVETTPDLVKLTDLVDQVMTGGRQAAVRTKRAILQQRIDSVAAVELGRARHERKTSGLNGRSSSWQCSKCGSRRKADLSYAGSYQRTIAFADGTASLRIPRLRCRCGGNVKPDFGAGLPKRKRHWYDLDLTAVELHTEGFSYRAVGRFLGRRGCDVGIGSLAGKMGAFSQVGINAGVAGEWPEALSLDAAFWRVGAGSRAHLYAHEVLKRDEPLVRDGQEVAWHRTGKVLACHLASGETQEAWDQTVKSLIDAQLVDDQEPLWAVSDGNQGLLAALDLHLPWSIKQRCCWHIAHRARYRVLQADKDAFERAALWVLNAGDVPDAFSRLARFAGRWLDKEPDAVSSVASKFDQGIEHLRHPTMPLRPRTVGISERYNQEPKRRFRAMRGFGAERNMVAMTRLIALRHNCIIDRTDWLAHAAKSVWDAPIATLTPQQQKRPQPHAYTKPGT